VIVDFDYDDIVILTLILTKLGEQTMNSDIAEGKWKQLSGSLKAQWGKLTDDDLQEIDGNLEKFQGKMQEKYGMGKEEAKKEFNKANA
jgi:uncharacterized protein YjbJ (UPF0337 family)